MLERLAATEEMFKAPVSTIRDVAELTDASPKLIARILGEMRDPDKIEKLESRVDTHDARLKEVEKKLNLSANPPKPAPIKEKPKAVQPPIKPKPLPKPPAPIAPPPEENVAIKAWKKAEKKVLDEIEQRRKF